MQNLYWIVAIVGGALAIWWIWRSIIKEQTKLYQSESFKKSTYYKTEIQRGTLRLGIIFFASFMVAGLLILWGYIILCRKGSPTATNGLLILAISLMVMGSIGLIVQISKYWGLRR
ncbi:MAG: hypothetical protein DRH44_08385 [Candidatus Coatesbacteria bacterium]|nr:MAG: hypothetical protein DRH44_08385 [Candidatus Coatesbacteria bacterium]RLC41323.1 MAG: hypothetical protein DRH49_05650 [Candidatus Coatesbacteria bacterium]